MRVRHKNIILKNQHTIPLPKTHSYLGYWTKIYVYIYMYHKKTQSPDFLVSSFAT